MLLCEGNQYSDGTLYIKFESSNQYNSCSMIGSSYPLFLDTQNVELLKYETSKESLHGKGFF